MLVGSLSTVHQKHAGVVVVHCALLRIPVGEWVLVVFILLVIIPIAGGPGILFGPVGW